MRRIDLIVILLPQPLSPTMPKIFLGYSLKLTPSTALTVPSSSSKQVLRFSTDNRGFTSDIFIRSCFDVNYKGQLHHAIHPQECSMQERLLSQPILVGATTVQVLSTGGSVLPEVKLPN